MTTVVHKTYWLCAGSWRLILTTPSYKFLLNSLSDYFITRPRRIFAFFDLQSADGHLRPGAVDSRRRPLYLAGAGRSFLGHVVTGLVGRDRMTASMLGS